MNEQDPLFEETRTKIYTVSTLTEKIKELLEENFDFIWVEAEISNFRAPSSGHYYLALKDETSQIRAVMFRPQTRYLGFTPEDGMKVIARGRISVYQPRGEYQIILDYLEPLGVGAMALAFEQLKKKLASEGVFDEEAKRPLPFLPQRVAVITSPTGAAIRDFLKVIHRRFANIEVTIIPVKVQGDLAAQEIVDAIGITNRELDSDVIVLTRGGGSMEDLWAFNNEELAYAIRASRIPVVSAVGHEIDITISDLAADFRAPTPSAAAEMLVAEKEALVKYLGNIKDRLKSVLKTNINGLNQLLATLKKGLRDPRKDIADSWLRLDELNNRLIRISGLIITERKEKVTAEGRALLFYSPAKKISSFAQGIAFQKHLLIHMILRGIKEKHMTLGLFEEKIKDLGPYSVLSRGYSITRILPDKKPLRSVSSVKAGDSLNVLITDGELDCRIEKIRKD
jgi:exodeoxyribonuclease VII large subunit